MAESTGSSEPRSFPESVIQNSVGASKVSRIADSCKTKTLRIPA